MPRRNWLRIARIAPLLLASCAGPTQGPTISKDGFVMPVEDASSPGTSTPDATPEATETAPTETTATDASPADEAPTDASPTDATDDSPQTEPDIGDANDDAIETPPDEPPAIQTFETATAAGDAKALSTWLAAYDMPVCDAAAAVCVFAVLAPQAKSLELMGEWDGWQQPTPMAPTALAPGWHFAKKALKVDKVLEYKVKIDGAWALDPSNRHIRFAAFGLNSGLYPSFGSRLLRIAAVASPALPTPRDLYVYLPAAYYVSKSTHFPVLYWQDGWNVFKNPKAPFGSWDVDVTADALMASGEVAPAIFVAIDTQDRMSEYVWVPLTHQNKTYVPKISAYAKLLTETIKPMIDAAFRTMPQRETTGIAGSSLGGISATWIAWHHWQTFGLFASFSGAFWVGEDKLSDSGKQAPGPPMRTLIATNAAKAPKGALRAYFDSGDTDFGGDVCYGCDAWAMSDWTRNALVAAGWDSRPEWDTDGDSTTPPTDLAETTPVAKVPALAWSASPAAGKTWKATLGVDKNLLSLVGHGHQHNEAAWKVRAGAALRYLLPGAALP